MDRFAVHRRILSSSFSATETSEASMSSLGSAMPPPSQWRSLGAERYNGAERMAFETSNFTGMLERAEAFFAAKCEHFTTDGLSVHIKYTRAKGRDFAGYYRAGDTRIVVAVKRRLRYPRDAAYGVGSVTCAKRVKGRRPYKLVWHEGRFTSPDDLLVFALGHETWHYLCGSGQRKGDHETKANCNGFLWLAEFQAWRGPGCRVAPAPEKPPRPSNYRHDVAAQLLGADIGTQASFWP